MNESIRSGKQLYFYSKRGNQFKDLSMATDEQFQKIEQVFGHFQIIEGSVFTGKYRYRGDEQQILTTLENDLKAELPQVQRLKGFFKDFEIDERYAIMSVATPDINRMLALTWVKSLNSSLDYLPETWGLLCSNFRHYGFGFDDIITYVGSKVKEERICRFCNGGTKSPTLERTFKDTAHAISEGLGNKLLFCYEECDTCNHQLNYLENNLIRLMDVRRTLGGIKTKTTGETPNVEGLNFVIRGDENDDPIVYLKAESLEEHQFPKLIKSLSSSSIRLHHSAEITHQNIYKALCKSAISLMPKEELSHFVNTIKWINNRLVDCNSPSMLVGYRSEFLKQPRFHLLFKEKGLHPYCTGLLEVCDMIYIFVLPFVDVDMGKYKLDHALEGHWRVFQEYLIIEEWQFMDTKAYRKSSPWVDLPIGSIPEIKFVITSEDNPVFQCYQRLDKEGVLEEHFPEFDPRGIRLKTYFLDDFKIGYHGELTVEDLRDVSIEFKQFDCRLDVHSSQANLSVSLSLFDSAGIDLYYSCSFHCLFEFDEFTKYIYYDEYSFSFDYHLRDYLLEIAFNQVEEELMKHRRGTPLEACSIVHAIKDVRVRRQLIYYLPTSDSGNYFAIEDKKIHNL